MEETLGGYKHTGPWPEIVVHGERLTAALQTCDEDADDDSLADWDEWRPKAHERLSTDISEKTAAKATLNESKGEQADTPAHTDLHDASHTAVTALPDIVRDPKTAGREFLRAARKFGRGTDTLGRKVVRPIERRVYKHIMTGVSPYYFDNQLLSATLYCTNTVAARRQSGTEPEYTLEVNIHDDELRECVRDTIEDDLTSMDDWQMDTEHETETAVAAEGVEGPVPSN